MHWPIPASSEDFIRKWGSRALAPRSVWVSRDVAAATPGAFTSTSTPDKCSCANSRTSARNSLPEFLQRAGAGGEPRRWDGFHDPEHLASSVPIHAEPMKPVAPTRPITCIFLTQ